MGWDEIWSEETSLKFANWMSEIEALENIKIRRCAELSHSRVDLHTFVDASQYAYAAVVYSRIETRDEVIVSLLSAKSRLAPIQKKKASDDTKVVVTTGSISLLFVTVCKTS